MSVPETNEAVQQASFSACAVAKFILEEHKNNPIPYMGSTKLMKLLYISQGRVLGDTLGRGELFSDEIEAWHYGPAIRSVYGEIKDSERRKEPFPAFKSYKEEAEKFAENRLLVKKVKDVIDRYKDHTAYRLTEITHKEGTPWAWAISNNELIIPKTRIAYYYAYHMRESNGGG